MYRNISLTVLPHICSKPDVDKWSVLGSLLYIPESIYKNPDGFLFFSLKVGGQDKYACIVSGVKLTCHWKNDIRSKPQHLLLSSKTLFKILFECNTFTTRADGKRYKTYIDFFKNRAIYLMADRFSLQLEHSSVLFKLPTESCMTNSTARNKLTN